MHYQGSPQQITARFHHSGVLLLLDAPEGLQFGIDNISWKVGSKFKGVKLIPLGTHVITYALKTENYMFPMKKFIFFGPSSKESGDEQRIRVYRWDRQADRFASLKGEQAQGYRQGVRKYHFDSYLGPYPQQNIEFWASNTKYIAKDVLDKLDPIDYIEDYRQEYESKEKKTQLEQEPANIDSQSQGDKNQMEEIEKQLQNVQINQDEPTGKASAEEKQSKKLVNIIKKATDFGGNIYYSQIPRRLSDQSTHTSLVNIDRTQILDKILREEWPKNEFGLLGELQYSFISFLIGQCLDSYNQWKQLVTTISASEQAFSTHKTLMLEFIVVLYEQLKQFPNDFFIDELAKDNFLTGCLQNMKYYLKDRAIGKKALARLEKLIGFVQEKFGYTVEEEQEEAPMVVQENQAYF